MFINEFFGATFFCTEDEKRFFPPNQKLCPIVKGEEVLDLYDIKKDFGRVWVDFGVIMGLYFGFRIGSGFLLGWVHKRRLEGNRG